MNSIQKSNLIVKLRASLYQMPNGELVGFGPLEAKRGNGYAFCYNCSVDNCPHVEAVNQAWLAGQSVEAQSIPFNGAAPEADSAPSTSSGQCADDYGLAEVTL